MERPFLLLSLLRFRECVYYVTFCTAVLKWLTQSRLEEKNLLLFTDREYGTSWQGWPGGRLHAHRDKPRGRSLVQLQRCPSWHPLFSLDSGSRVWCASHLTGTCLLSKTSWKGPGKTNQKCVSQVSLSSHVDNEDQPAPSPGLIKAAFCCSNVRDCCWE